MKKGLPLKTIKIAGGKNATTSNYLLDRLRYFLGAVTVFVVERHSQVRTQGMCVATTNRHGYGNERFRADHR